MSQRELLLGDVAKGVRALPFVSLAKVPTPVTHLRSIGENVWAKRDDLISDVYGGNKVRRYELLLGEAMARGHDRLLTLGGVASTQVTATARFAQALGLKARAVLFDQVPTPFLREALSTDVDAGLEIVRGGSIPRATLRFVREVARSRAYVLSPGASGPLANLGYVDAALELGRQVDEGLLPRPDRIVLPTGSGGTAAGLLVGLRILGWPTVVTAVRIAERAVVNAATLGYRVVQTTRLARSLGATVKRGRARITIEPRFLGAGYGAWSPAAERGAARIEEIFGLPGEITYSGKAMAALERIAVDHPRDNVLFWCTLSSTGRVRDPSSATPDWSWPLLQKAERERDERRARARSSLESLRAAAGRAA